MGESVNVIPKGTALFTEKPFAYCLDNAYARERCDNCLNEPKHRPRMCTGCQYVHYCDEKCQKEAWKNHHKYECKIIKAQPKVIHKDVLYFMRILNKLKHGGREERVYVTETEYKTFDSLMTHEAEMIQNYRKMVTCKWIAQSLKKLVKHLDMEVVLEIFCKVEINGFRILSTQLFGIASGLYLGCSTIDHSCDPTCNYIFHGIAMEVRNIKDIPNFAWNKVTLSYKGPLNVREKRREYLRENYYFFCECERCLDEDMEKLMNSMQCPNGECKAAIYIERDIAKEISCHNCHVDIPWPKIEEYRYVMEICDDMYKLNMSTGKEQAIGRDLKSFECVMNMQNGLLHPLNVYVVKVLDDAFEAAIKLGMNEKGQEYGVALLEGIKKYYAEHDYVVSRTYMKLMQTAFLMGNTRAASAWYEKCLETTKISIGEKHYLYGFLKETFRDGMQLFGILEGLKEKGDVSSLLKKLNL